MPRLPLQILLAIVLVLAANHYWNPETAESPDLDTSARRHELPKTYLEVVRAWTFDEGGKLTDIVEAERLEQWSQVQLIVQLDHEVIRPQNVDQPFGRRERYLDRTFHLFHEHILRTGSFLIMVVPRLELQEYLQLLLHPKL